MFYIYLFLTFMQGSYAVYDLKSMYLTSDASRDYEYIRSFLKEDIYLNEDKLYSLQTQAYNTLRIIWENQQVFSTVESKPTLKLAIDYFIYSIINKYAIHKARSILLKLDSNDLYKYDSGIKLAIALSYYLDGFAINFNHIKFYMKKWSEFGKNKPKNLMKTTEYVDSITTITELCIVSGSCDNF